MGISGSNETIATQLLIQGKYYHSVKNLERCYVTSYNTYLVSQGKSLHVKEGCGIKVMWLIFKLKCSAWFPLNRKVSLSATEFGLRHSAILSGRIFCLVTECCRIVVPCFSDDNITFPKLK